MSNLGGKLFALGLSMSLVFSHFYEPLFIAGAIIIIVGLGLMFFYDRP